MKTIKSNRIAKNKEVARGNNIPLKAKIGSTGKKGIVFPEEFEEDRSMNIRMKPQPYQSSAKKATPGKEKK